MRHAVNIGSLKTGYTINASAYVAMAQSPIGNTFNRFQAALFRGQQRAVINMQRKGSLKPLPPKGSLKNQTVWRAVHRAKRFFAGQAGFSFATPHRGLNPLSNPKAA